MTGLLWVLACGDLRQLDSGLVSGCAVGEVAECVDATAGTYSTGEPTGFETCSDGSQNRVTALPAPLRLKACEDYYDGGGNALCESDADCGDGTYCEYSTSGLGNGCSCEPFPCELDANCAPGEACWFGDCIAADCRSNSDCESGQCGLWSEPLGTEIGDLYGLTCRSPRDECRGVNTDSCACGAEFECLNGCVE